MLPKSRRRRCYVQIPMNADNRFSIEDLPDAPHARQLSEGFPWLVFSQDLEVDFRRHHLQENLRYLRINLVLGFLMLIAFSVMESAMLGQSAARIPNAVHFLVIVPAMLLMFACTFSEFGRRHFAQLMMIAGSVVGLGVVATQIIAAQADAQIETSAQKLVAAGFEDPRGAR